MDVRRAQGDMRNSKMKMILVKWVDTSGMSGEWIPIEEAKMYKLVCTKTIGWFISEDNEQLMVSMNVSEPSMDIDTLKVRDITIIPKSSILWRKELIEKQ